MHTKCCRGKVSKKFKIFNNKPDRGKSERKNQNNSRIYLRQRLFYFAHYSISIYTSHKFLPSKYTITSSWGKVSQYTWNRCLSFQKHLVKVYMSILILNIYKTYTKHLLDTLLKKFNLCSKVFLLDIQVPFDNCAHLPIKHTAADVPLFAQKRRRLVKFIHACQLIIHLRY